LIGSLDKRERTEIFFFDEGRFGLRSTILRYWAKKGTAIKVKVKQGYKSFYLYSAVSPYSGDNFTLILPGVCVYLMTLYFQKLEQYLNGKRAIVIMDQAGWHRAKDLYIPENIRIIYLPPYSPELNPVERLWRQIKKVCIHNRIFDTLEEMNDNISECINSMTNESLKNLCHCSYLLT
jgi:transposase